MANLLHRQLSYRPPSYEHSSLSQPAEYDRSTLPRQRRNNTLVAPAAPVGLTHNPASARRQILSSTVADYLKSLNSMTRSIVLEKECVEEKHASDWGIMDEAQQEEVVDEHFMPPDVHAHYGTLPRSRPASRGSSRGGLEQAGHHDEVLLRNRTTVSLRVKHFSCKRIIAL